MGLEDIQSTVEVPRSDDGRLGISMEDNIISEVDPRHAATIKVGDRVLAVNGQKLNPDETVEAVVSA